MAETLALVALAGAGGYSAYSATRAGKAKPPTAVTQPLAVQEKPADYAKDELLKRLAKLRRATQVSQLTEPNVKRTTLGAGAI